MSGFQLLVKPGDIVYRYDGSFSGFYCCVHASVYGRELPFAILSDTNPQACFLPSIWVEADQDKAQRVRDAILRKISPRALELCEHVLLTCLEGKELALLHFLIQGFQIGGNVADSLTDPVVASLLDVEKHLLNEAHLLSGFIRFADSEGKLVATITPKNYVLPILAPHFANRFAEEILIIYDSTHKVALLCVKGRTHLMNMENWMAISASEIELHYQQLWKQFCATIAIEGRENARCRRTHMPKRYWENILEMRNVQ